jgi:hypothetical protein
MSVQTKIGMFGNPSSEFFISEDELQRFLVANQARESDYWLLQSKGLKLFAKKIEKLFVVSNGGFTFQATWEGESTTCVKSMSIVEFLAIVKKNHIGKRTKYVVVGSV